MKWCELKIAPVDGEVAESLSEALGSLVAGAVAVEQILEGPTFAEEPTRSCAAQYVVRGYLPEEQLAPRLEEIQRALFYLRALRDFPELQIRTLEEVDWSRQWRKAHTPFPVGRRLWIVPGLESGATPSGRVVVHIEPGKAFGVGSHPSTQLALELIEDELQAGDRVLDVGCGSGILSIAALQLGATRAVACDVEPQAPKATLLAAQHHRLHPRLVVYRGSIDATCGRYDLVVINILARILQHLIPAVPERLRSQGKLLLSGILKDSEAEVQETLRRAGLRVLKRRTQQDWVGLKTGP